MTTLVLLAIWLAADPAVEPSAAQRAAARAVAANAEKIADWANRIWRFAEPAFQEHESSTLLAEALAVAGFRVERGVAGMKTSFVAEYGKGKPVVAILAEYDALPGLAQDAVPRRQPLERGRAGHGCGHNLFGTASTAAAIAVRAVIDEHALAGTVRLYGCPAEEGGGGKVYLVRDGRFKDVDAVLHWHPSTSNDASPRSCLAVVRFRVRFRGKSAHAAGSPQSGRSALDGVELMNVGLNFLREHIPSSARLHYVITNGGRRPNVVPDFAEGWYYVRAPRMKEAQAIHSRLVKIANGAALMSETEASFHGLSGTYELLGNWTLARVVDRNLRAAGPPSFAAAEVEFAAALRKELAIADDQDLRTGGQGPVSDRIAPFRIDGPPGNGSTDVGDVSWNAPTAGVNIATAARGVPSHSWAFTACAGSELGRRGCELAARVLATSAVELLESPATLAKAREEFLARAKAAAYAPVLDPGPPPDRLDAE